MGGSGTAERSSLVVDGLSKTYGDRRALDGVSFEVPDGQMVGLLGPNGAGKTTLMRAIFGVVVPDEGTVTWNGQPVGRSQRLGWGYMPQERGLYTTMKVIDQLVWTGRLFGLDTMTARTNAGQLLDELGIGDRAGEKIKNLSGGMQQRAQLANALVHRPSLLVLDEPFAGLDPTAVEFLSDVMFQHVAQGNTLLFSSHQLDLVERICSSVILVDGGQVVMEGSLADLRATSTARYLEVDADLTGYAGPHGDVTSMSPAASRLRLNPNVDALAALDDIRADHTITKFAVEMPTLSELFLAAVNTPDRDDRQHHTDEGTHQLSVSATGHSTTGDSASTEVPSP